MTEGAGDGRTGFADGVGTAAAPLADEEGDGETEGDEDGYGELVGYGSSQLLLPEELVSSSWSVWWRTFRLLLELLLFEPLLLELLLLELLLFELFANRLTEVAPAASVPPVASLASTSVAFTGVASTSLASAPPGPAGADAGRLLNTAGNTAPAPPNAALVAVGTAGVRLGDGPADGVAAGVKTCRVSGQACASSPAQPVRASAATAVTTAAGPVRFLIGSPPCPGAAARSRSPAAAA
ncbi:hypothetical protein [Kitasatospora indigofera]|uniref:hypothetical protein n=1 Tax=Kitasatospora indigofera TaxID=67307 RepID=UPI00369D6FB3